MILNRKKKAMNAYELICLQVDDKLEKKQALIEQLVDLEDQINNDQQTYLNEITERLDEVTVQYKVKQVELVELNQERQEIRNELD